MKIWTFMLLCVSILFAQGSSMKQKTIQELQKMHGPEHAARIEIGVNQVMQLWQEQDGTPDDLYEFCVLHFIADPTELQNVLNRFERNFEIIFGHNHEINRDLSMPVELEMGKQYKIDNLFAEYSPFAHFQDDMFKNKIAFVCLLNFPISSLDEKIENAENWSRREWAQARLAELFETRPPASVEQARAKAYVQADDYIANYNVYMHHLVNDKGERLFPEGLKLITHWGLRDELKSHYGQQNGLSRQLMIYEVMQDIITQDIPQQAINNNAYDWDPVRDELLQDGESIEFEPEADTRYEKLLSVFHAEQQLDDYYPHLPTKIDRRFQQAREIPQERFEAILHSVLTAPVGKKVATLISKRLGRDLQPFDIWYDGFKSRSAINQTDLDRITGERYPNVAAFQDDLPTILTALGFSAERADFLQTKITVDPSRGAGHASGAMRKADNAHLRTRIPQSGMKYKGFNIAIHELGHNVEQVYSLNLMDHYMLNGVPNTAFTEAFAFVFQSRDLDVLAVSQPDEMAEHMKALDTYWSTCEIAAVGIVDMRVWQWMYDHPDATAAELKDAVLQIAQDVWNEYYYPLTGVKDSIILGIYSHMIAYGLYLPDYSMGHIIMFQIEQYLKDKNLGTEMERMCKIGRVTPDFWMQQAVGSPISAEPLIQATGAAVKVLK